MEKTFKSPLDKEGISISADDSIPHGNSLGNVIQNEINKKKIEKTIFQSNNQIYKKKEDIEYGKKSHLEYLKFINQNKDPLNIQYKGGLKPITMSEVKKHNTKSSMWTVLNGNVYDLTMYIDYHPGGEKKLMMGAGKDYKYHPWVNHNNLVGKLQIGYLVKDQIGSDDEDDI